MAGAAAARRPRSGAGRVARRAARRGRRAGRSAIMSFQSDPPPSEGGWRMVDGGWKRRHPPSTIHHPPSTIRLPGRPMEFANRVTLVCFAASYAVALGLEVWRHFRPREIVRILAVVFG